jgi:hypothetical protein
LSSRTLIDFAGSPALRIHVLTPFVERLATEEEKKAGDHLANVLNRTPAELQTRCRNGRREHASSS